MDYNLIFECRFGSHLYGTNTPESDEDFRGVCIPYLNVWLSPFSNFEQQEFSGEDKTYYGLKKFFQLASQCNPNIVELLFVPPELTLKEKLQWKYIQEDRYLFLSQKCRFTFSGYADAQLKRIKLHRLWLLNPPKKEPVRSDFGLKDSPECGMEKIENLIHVPEEFIKPGWKEYALAEKSYHSAREYWNKYMDWSKNRNPKRKDIENKFGYDTKHASHLYRLLTEAEELLSTGLITLPRPDREILLEIRGGLFSYDELIEIGNRFKEVVDSIETKLPQKPDIKSLEQLYFKVLFI